MDLKNIAILLTSFIEFVLGLLVFLSYQGKKVKIVFTLLVLSVLLWGIFMVFYRLSTDVVIALFWLKFVYSIGPIFAPLFYVYFTFTFAKQNLYNKVINSILLIPSLLLLVFIINSDFIIKDVILEHGKEGKILFGDLYYIYGFYIISYFTFGYVNLFRSYKVEVDRISRIQLLYVFLGTFIASFSAIFTNLILPTFHIFYLFWVGPISTISLVVFIFYAISRHHLLDIKIIGTEIFSAILAIVLFINIFVYNSPTELIIKIVIFVSWLIVSLLLVLASLREFNQKESIETLNEQLQASVEELQKLDQLKTDFLNLASHQLRTPLTPIKGFSDMLRRGDVGALTPEQHELADKIFFSSERMVELIDDFLNVSRLEKQKGFTYNFVIDNPENTIKKVVDDLRDQAKVKGISLTFTSHLRSQTKIRFDALMFSDAVGNVLGNAVKYTLRGNVWVSISEDDKEVIISVKDTGVGIDKDDIPKIFQKFFRGKEVARLSTEGTGLGLYFTRRVIEDHGGHIWVQSEGLEKGAEFTIKLPKIQEQPSTSLTTVSESSAPKNNDV